MKKDSYYIAGFILGVVINFCFLYCIAVLCIEIQKYALGIYVIEEKIEKIEARER